MAKVKPKRKISQVYAPKPEASVCWGQLRLEFPVRDLPSHVLIEILRYVFEEAEVITSKEMEDKIDKFLVEREQD